MREQISASSSCGKYKYFAISVDCPKPSISAANCTHLELNPTKVLESLLITVLEVTEGVKEAERGLDADLVIERTRERGRTGSGLLGRESGGRAEDGSDESSAEHDWGGFRRDRELEL